MILSMSRSTDEMEIKEPENIRRPPIKIAKPVASRPTSSSFRTSFTELLAGAINASPSNNSNTNNEMTAVTAIRPKTVRPFKPNANPSSPPPRPPALLVARPTAEPLGTTSAAYNSAKDAVKPDSKLMVVYKPLAKVVSKSTLSVLANMGNYNAAHQPVQAPPETRVRKQPTEKPSWRSQLTPNPHSSPSRPNQTASKPSKPITAEDDPKAPRTSPANVDRPSYDGYNWRKYGQKQVKGSEYPRSYYKCTHPNCPVKKKVERSLDGQIAEIVYKGEHNHPKPQPPKRSSSSGPQQEAKTSDANQAEERNNEGLDRRVESNRITEKEDLVQSSNDKGLVCNGAGMAIPESTGAVRGGGEDGGKGIEEEEEEEDEPGRKRRKIETLYIEAGSSVDGTPENLVVVQNSVEPEIAGDGFRWRKYGQKVVKGNSYPRSYYRCTSLKCNVRKHVERVSDDPRTFMTTYEGRHNHEMPVKSSNTAGTEPEPQAGAASKDNP